MPAAHAGQWATARRTLDPYAHVIPAPSCEVRVSTTAPHEVGASAFHAGVDQCADGLTDADAPALKTFRLDILWKICHITNDDPHSKSANPCNRRRQLRSGIEWAVLDSKAGCLGRQQQE